MKITIYQTGRYDISNLKKRCSSFFFLYQAVIGINGDSEYLITNSAVFGHLLSLSEIFNSSVFFIWPAAFGHLLSLTEFFNSGSGSLAQKVSSNSKSRCCGALYQVLRCGHGGRPHSAHCAQVTWCFMPSQPLQLYQGECVHEGKTVQLLTNLHK